MSLTVTVSSCNVHTCVIPSGKRSSKHTSIWDKLVGMVKAKEKAAMPSGDAALIHTLYNPKNVQVGLQLNVTPLFHAYQAMAGRMAVEYLYLSRVLGAAPIKAPFVHCIIFSVLIRSAFWHWNYF